MQWNVDSHLLATAMTRVQNWKHCCFLRPKKTHLSLLFFLYLMMILLPLLFHVGFAISRPQILALTRWLKCCCNKLPGAVCASIKLWETQLYVFVLMYARKPFLKVCRLQQEASLTMFLFYCCEPDQNWKEINYVCDGEGSCVLGKKQYIWIVLFSVF